MKRRPPKKILFTYMLKYNAVQWTTKRLLQIPIIKSYKGIISKL